MKSEEFWRLSIDAWQNQTKPVKIVSNKEFPLAFIPEMDSQVLELPYVGKNLSMLIILPNEIQDETTGLQKVRQQRLYFIQHILNLLKWRSQNVFFCSEALEKLFLVFQIFFLHVKNT